MKIARPATLILAVALCAWFVLGIRQADDVTRATNAIEGSRVLTVTQLHTIDSWLQAARTFNPDAEIDILRGRAAIKAGRIGLAQRILAGVSRDEPMNLEGWIWLAGSALGDPSRARRAVAQIDKLDPHARQR